MRVVVHYVEHGNAGYLADGGKVEFLIVDDRCARDRVYRLSSHQAETGVIDDLIGDSPVGVAGDMPREETAIRDFLDGGPLTKPSTH